MTPADLDIWIAQECTLLGLALTPGRQEWFRHQAAAENTGARNNPLATTLAAPLWEDTNDPWWNTFAQNEPWGPLHVRNYRSIAAGAAATAATYSQANFGKMLQSLAEERVVPGVVAQVRLWGSIDFANELEAGWIPTGWAGAVVATPVVPVPLTADQLNDALQKRMALRRVALIIQTRAEDPDLSVVEAHLAELVAAGFRP